MEKLSDIRYRLQYLLDKLPYLLEDVTVEVFGQPNMNLCIDTFSLYAEGETQLEHTYIYLCRPEHLLKLNPAYQDAVLLCVNNGPGKVTPPEGFQVVVLNCTEDLGCVFNKLQKNILALKRNNSLINRAIVEKMNLDEILKIAESTIKNPFLLLDAEFHLVGWSKTRECPDPLYQQTIETGAIPHTYVMKLMAANSMRKLYLQGTTVLSKGQFLETYSVIIVMLREKNMILGYGMSICSNREVRPPMIQGFEDIICKFRNCLIARSEASYFQENKDCFFYNMLLSADVSDSSEIQQYAQELHISMEQERTLHVLLCADNLPVQYALKALLGSVGGYEAALIHGNSIVIVDQSADSDHPLSASVSYHNFLSNYDAQAGISVPFHHLTDIRRAYQQAAACAKMGRLLYHCDTQTYFDYQRRICRYADLLPFLLIDREYNDAGYFPVTRPRLLYMLRQDEAKHTELARTLFVYLKNNGHIIETAQEMFFHRNSILHRIKQISEILKVDLADCRVREELFFNFRVIDYARAAGKMEELLKMTGETEA